MPKQIFKIDSLIGGLNTATDKQAIEDVEISLSDGVETFNKGRINLTGQFETKDYDDPSFSGEGIKNFDCYPGTGLFQFKSDKPNGHIHFMCQFGTVIGFQLESDQNPVATVRVLFESPLQTTIQSGAFKDCEIFIRDSDLWTDYYNRGDQIRARILHSTQSDGTEIYLEYTSEGYEHDLSSGEEDAWVVGDRIGIAPKNEEVEYFVKSSFDSLEYDSDQSYVSIYSTQKNGGNYWGPLQDNQGYRLGTRINFRPKTSFYYVDGALRWSDGESANFSASDQKSNKFLGYLKTSIVHDNERSDVANYRANALEVDGWWQGDAFLSEPIIGQQNERNSVYFLGGYLFESETDYLPLNPGSFGVSITYNVGNYGFDDSGTWTQTADNKYNYYVSYIANDGSESTLAYLGSVDGEWDLVNQVIQIGVNDRDFLHDRRIVGIKVYWQKDGTASWSGAASKNYMFLCEFHIEKGFRASTDTSYSRLTSYGRSDSNVNRKGLKSKLYEFKNPPLVASWESETGHLRSDVVSDVRFQTSVIAGRRVYIGNVTYDNANYEDLILQSNVNQFDTFPFSNRLETTRLDGSEIIKLEEYADRLLQFKTDRLDIINIAGEVDILEESYPFKGVTGQGAVCKTDYGIAWVNEYGCYLFDGSQILNLLERQNFRLIDAKEWKDFIRFGKDTTDHGIDMTDIDVSPIIGYIPKDRRLIIANADALTTMSDITNNDTTEYYIYNLITQSWAKSMPGYTGLRSGSNNIRAYCSNFINDKDGNLMVALGKTNAYGRGDGELKLFKDKNEQTVASREFKFYTKAYDFGMPGVNKKIHKVYFHYKGQGHRVTIKMYSDLSGTTNETHTFAATNGSQDTTPLSDTSDGAVYQPKTEGFKIYNNTAKNVVRVWFSFEASGLTQNFELYDINVVYRPKSIK
tara:strand:- start:1390 stop:4140 length:2751 start_codon:yes stop_codon:yes gene_type:complete